MSQYLILLYSDESSWAAASQQELDELHAGHTSFQHDHAAAIRGGNQLMPSMTATSVRQNASGIPTVTDGAFAETKEALGGYYVIEAADLDEALAVAKAVPARFGGVEIRPLHDSV